MHCRSLMTHATLAALSLAATAAAAQGGPPQGGSLRAAVLTSSEVYAGEGRQSQLVPLIGYEGARVYWRGIAGGYRLLPPGGDWALDLTLGARLDGFDAKNLGLEALGRRGVARERLEDREIGVDLGIRAEWDSPIGELGLHLQTDIADRSRGQELALRYGWPVQSGATRLTPYLELTRWSSRLADYYFGMLDTEVARGLPRYRPGAVNFTEIGVEALHPLGGGWSVFGNAAVRTLPAAVRASPLVEPGTRRSHSLLIGVSRAL